MRRFFREWWNVLVEIVSAVGGPTMLMAIAKIAGTVAGMSAFAALAVFLGKFTAVIPWWVISVTLMALAFLSVTLGVAWERSRLPNIEISGPLIERSIDGLPCLYVWIINRQPSTVVVKPYINEIRVAGTRIGWMDHSLEGHWRSKPGFDGMLRPGEPAKYGLFGAGVSTDGNPCLFLWAEKSQQAANAPAVPATNTVTGQLVAFSQFVSQHVPYILPDVPLRDQPDVEVDFFVAWEKAKVKPESESEGKPVTATIRIRPDHESEYNYTAVTVAYKNVQPSA